MPGDMSFLFKFGPGWPRPRERGGQPAVCFQLATFLASRGWTSLPEGPKNGWKGPGQEFCPTKPSVRQPQLRTASRTQDVHPTLAKSRADRRKPRVAYWEAQEQTAEGSADGVFTMGEGACEPVNFSFYIKSICAHLNWSYVFSIAHRDARI